MIVPHKRSPTSILKPLFYHTIAPCQMSWNQQQYKNIIFPLIFYSYLDLFSFMFIFMVMRINPADGFRNRRYKMTTLKYVNKLIIDSTGPLRKIRLPDGLYVVGEQMLIAVDSEEEADDVIKQLKSELEQ
jgi:hypothetical protein